MIKIMSSYMYLFSMNRDKLVAILITGNTGIIAYRRASLSMNPKPMSWVDNLTTDQYKIGQNYITCQRYMTELIETRTNEMYFKLMNSQGKPMK